MIDPQDFLESIQGYTEKVAPANRAHRLGTIDPAYTAGKPKVLFDGATTLSTDGFAFVGNYQPVAEDRVVLAPVGNTYLIIGKPGDTATSTDIDHGSLTGLADNDHPQYSLTSHNHDGVYRDIQTPVYSGYQTAGTAAVQGVPDNTWTIIYMYADHADDLGQSGSLPAPTVSGVSGYAGWYLALGTVFFQSGTAGVRLASIRKNGSTYIKGSATRVGGNPGDNFGMSALTHCVVYLNGSSDYISLMALQSSGGTLNTYHDTFHSSSLQLVYLGA